MAEAEQAATDVIGDDSTLKFNGSAMDDSTMRLPDAALGSSFVTQASQAAGSESGGQVHLGAYYSRRGKPKAQLRPSASEVHMQRNPGVASQVLAVHALQHQVLPNRATPQPYDGSQLRWPHPQCGGPPDHLDGRRHANWFGYRQLRWAKHWLPLPEKIPDAVPELSLADCVHLLTMQHGSLKAAFKKLDFFQDGKISATEWQEGIYQLILRGSSVEFMRFKMLLQHRSSFDARAMKLFLQMDKDKNGLVSFEEMGATKDEPSESPWEFSKRRLEETSAAREADEMVAAKTLSRRSVPRPLASGLSIDTMDMTLPLGLDFKLKASIGPTVSDVLRCFTAVLMTRFPNLDQAFAFFDHNESGILGMQEFVQGAKDLRFGLDAKAVFKELDTNRDGAISKAEFKLLRNIDVEKDEAIVFKTKRETVVERKLRSPIQATSQFKRGDCLDAIHIDRPHGEHVSSAAHYYTFPRLPTGRLDDLLHPNELPGFDPQNFTKEVGPGYTLKGPPHHPEVASHGHPLRGDKFKVGANLNRTDRFGASIPSHEGKKDLENSALSFISYEGSRPVDGKGKVNGTGAISMVSKRERVGLTHGTSDSFGLLGPTPIGKWEHSRMSLQRKCMSEPSLLKKVC
ncbi:unnamed protein product [Polarella glacialis]|uniref:EF-hand domain-containing protein n=1 Tax=Polarella glacialis TaxID=89957 RepID=A0A813GXQ2_POLGL|nr:unnamed protein product [Polarella glacialis]CAE8700448.1 unnamed protein product [Polarella glacialis]